MSYVMLDWMTMSPALRVANHLAGTELDGVTPTNHLYTQQNAGNYYAIKGDGGYPADINIFDNTYIYLSSTENSAGTGGGFGDPHQAKRFESLNSAIGLKGVPYAKRVMNIGDAVYSTDSRFAIYTACGTATYSQIGYVKVTLLGPFTETITGAGGNLPANLTTIHLTYEWGLDVNYNHQTGSTMETNTFCQPYGWVAWQTQNWNVGNGSYDAPNNASHFNILVPGAGPAFVDPCGFGTNGGGGPTVPGPPSGPPAPGVPSPSAPAKPIISLAGPVSSATPTGSSAGVSSGGRLGVGASSLPFSASRPRTLPTITPSQNIHEALANWQTQLNPGVKNAAPQATPQNFSVTNSRGGLTLKWSPVSGGDGYEILKSADGSFSDDLQIIPVKNVNQSNFFDGLGGAATTVGYRIRTTSGTAMNPQSQRGPESGPVRHTSIDATDTTSAPVTIFDTSTNDRTRSLARLGNYGAIKLTPLGKTGGSIVGIGAKSPTGAARSREAVQAQGTSFADIGTGSNSSGVLIVAAGASIVPDPNSPGVIAANELQSTPITGTAPADQQVLQYSAASGEFVYTSIIATGTQASLQSVLPLGLGEIYVATDTGNLFIGTPGIGAGYIQVSDMSQLNDTFQQVLAELKNIRLVIMALDNTLLPQDFEAFGKQIENGDAVGETQ